MAKLFSDREIRAIAVFLPLAGLLIIALMLVRPAAGPAWTRLPIWSGIFTVRLRTWPGSCGSRLPAFAP